jgi:hypothetical protein
VPSSLFCLSYLCCMELTRETVMAACAKLGYRYFDNGYYNMNVISVRNSEPGKKVTNIFDDWMTLSYKDGNGVWQFHKWACTTDPGTKAVKHFSNAGGVARIVPGQYPKSLQMGYHQGKYAALKQCGPMTVYRDANKDMVFDETKTQTGIFGLNIHHAGEDSSIVEDWSEGCSVFKRKKDFKQFMKIVQLDLHSKWTYTVLESRDL